MKKTWTFISIFLLLTFHINAQESFKPSTHLGIHTGINLCFTNFNPSISQELYTASNTGLVFRHISEPRIGIQAELNIGQKGWIENRDSSGNYKRVLHVYDIPVMAVFLFGKRNVKFSFSVGPYLSYRRKETESFNVNDTAYFRDYYNKSLENKWEFGLTAGFGLELHSRIGLFALRASYCYSLTNLFPLNVPEFYYEDSNMQVIQAGIFYMINL